MMKRSFLSLVIILSIAYHARAIPAYTIPDNLGCDGESLIVPVIVDNYSSVMSWVLNIVFDHNVLNYTGYQNFAGNGFVQSSIIHSQTSDFDSLHLSGQCFPPLSLPNGSILIFLKFSYIAGAGLIQIAPGTYPAGNYHHGLVTPGLVSIIEQPENTLVAPGEMAYFHVLTLYDTGIIFQWQQSVDGVNWVNLADSPPYYDSYTPLLIIDPVPEIFDLYQYRCIIEGCTIDTTQPAILEVNAITTVQLTLTYANAFSSAVSDAAVTFLQGGVPVGGSVTDQYGQFSLDNLPPGTCEIQVAIPHPWNGVNAIDGMTILKHFAGIQPLTGMPLAAADVNLSGSVNSIDAMMVIQRFVGMIGAFDIPDWIIDVQSVEIPVIGIVNLPIETICAGDTNASNVP